MSKYGNITIVSGLSLGAILAFTYVVLTDANAHLAFWSGIGSGLVIGIGIAVATYMTECPLRRKGYDVAASKVHQEIDITLPSDPHILFELCAELIDASDQISLESRDDERQVLTARTAPSIRCLGERIRVIVRRINDDESRVWILSRPRVRPTIVDFGKNLQNVVGIKEDLDSRFKTLTGARARSTA